MASRKEYLDYVLEQLSDLEGVTHRAMMGEYLLYVQGKLFGGVYDDRLLVKPVPAARALLPDAPEEAPYEGAKPMLLVEDMEDSALLARLVTAMEPELPAPKKNPKKSNLTRKDRLAPEWGKPRSFFRDIPMGVWYNHPKNRRKDLP